MNDNILLEIQNLRTHFFLDEGTVKAVDGISLEIENSKTLGVIGEGGCGKSVTAHSILRIIPSPGIIVDGNILFNNKNTEKQINLTKLNSKGEQIRNIRGNEISMIFQEPMTSFGPLHTIGEQIMEAILIHNPDMNETIARDRTIDLLNQVGIPKAKERIDSYPHEFSGGMRQRAMIAMALSCSPQLLIADEPTTSVDVTIEAQILDLLDRLQKQHNMSIMLITHNLAVISELADKIVVMYLGKRVEFATMKTIFENPLHPYTKGLWRSIPKLTGKLTRLKPIKGVVPSPTNLPEGCPFAPRCEEKIKGVCNKGGMPPVKEIEPGHFVSCHKYTNEKYLD